MKNAKKKIIVSACLAGIPCRYDGKDKLRQEVQELVASGKAIPVCPEELGGLPTPRPAVEEIAGKIRTKGGEDLTYQYQDGAQRALKEAILHNCSDAILKSRSPMCGFGTIYDGTHTGSLKKGDGLLSRLLMKAGINIRSMD